MAAGNDNENNDGASVTPSICEEALEGYRHAEDTFASLIQTNHIEVREFMILSFVCDQEGLEVVRLRSALGLSRETTYACVSHLSDAGLVVFDINENGRINGPVKPTPLGHNVVRRVLSDDTHTT